MSIVKTIEPDRHAAAAILGRKGGAAGTGAAKVRSKKNIAKAVKARIAANKARKFAREAVVHTEDCQLGQNHKDCPACQAAQ